MKNLTEAQMLDMVNANTFNKDIDRDPNHYDMQSVNRGKELLNNWKMRFTKRTTQPNYAHHTKDADNAVCIDAGWIATSPAYRFAIFEAK